MYGGRGYLISSPPQPNSFLQILMHNIDQFLGRGDLRRIPRLARIDHMFTDVVLDDLRDKAVQGAAARGGLLKDHCAFVVGIDGTLDRLDLAPHAFEAIQELGFFFCDVAHNSRKPASTMG